MSRTSKKKTNQAPINSAVIYARYSSNNKGGESIGAQVRERKKYAQDHGLNIVNIYADHLDDSPESIIFEGVLETICEYYSKNLS